MLPLHQPLVALEEVGVVGVHECLETGFGIDHHDLASLRQLVLERVGYAQRDRLMLARELAQRPVHRVRVEIRDQENERTPVQRADEEIAGGGDRRARRGGSCDKDLADHAEQVTAALFRRNEHLRIPGEEQQADLVAILQRAETQHRGSFRSHLALAEMYAAEVPRRGDVHRDDDR